MTFSSEFNQILRPAGPVTTSAVINTTIATITRTTAIAAVAKFKFSKHVQKTNRITSRVAFIKMQFLAY